MITEYAIPLLLDVARERLAEFLKRPAFEAAFKTASERVAKRYEGLLNEYTAAAVSTSAAEEATSLNSAVLTEFEDLGFPSPDQLTAWLMDAWSLRKASLAPGMAAPLFAAEEHEVRPMFADLGRELFRELAQCEEFSRPFLVHQALTNANKRAQSVVDRREDALPYHVEQFNLGVSKLLDASPRSGPQFALTCSDGSRRFDSTEFFSATRKYRQVFLAGPAGSGKTEILQRAIDEIRQNPGFELLPVYLDLTLLSRLATPLLDESSEKDAFDVRWDVMLSMAVPPLKPSALAALSEHAIPVIIADRLNEVPGPRLVEVILRTLSEFSRRSTGRVYLLVAGRSIPDSAVTHWRAVNVDPLEVSVSREHVDHAFGNGTYDSLPAPDRELLTLPYYLEITLNSNAPETGTAAVVIKNFIERVGVKGEEWQLLAEGAFCAYQENGSTRFPADPFKSRIGPEMYDRLRHANVIEELADGQSRFKHQLHHDFLAAKHLADTKGWRVSAYDAVSLRANSFEGICMVLQQVESPSDGDKFLRTLYDWNLSAATTALKDAERVQRKPFTPELEAALLALHSEKLFDNVRPTQTRARNFFNQLKGGIGGQIASAGSMSAVFSIVKAISSDVEWFVTWRQLFTNEAAFGERELSLLNSSDPILGWTAANVARRFDLTDADQRQVREIYRTRCFDTSEKNEFAFSDTVRWGVVHVLGAFPSAENVELLLGALDSDRYHWTRYGAARSLVEIAAKSDSAIRSAVLDGLMTRLGLFARAGMDGRSLLAEIRRAADYERATGDWAAASSRLVHLISAAEEGLPLDTALST